MFKAGFAQEIITPPIGVDLAGYMNERLNKGMYDDLYVKVIAFEVNGRRFRAVPLIRSANNKTDDSLCGGSSVLFMRSVLT